MKILFCIPEMCSGGAERVLALLCNGLVDRGYDVLLATDLDKKIFYTLHESIILLPLYPSKKHRANFIGKVYNNFFYYRHIRKLIKGVSPDVIISFLYILNPKVILASRGLNIPVISSEHINFIQEMNFLKKIRRLYINRFADKVTILTRQDYEYLGKRLPNKVIMPNPLTYSTPETSLCRKNIVLAVGNLNDYKRKGFDRLILSWSRIASCYPDWSLYLAGRGEPEIIGLFNHLILTHGVRKQVRLLGPVEDMQSLYREASISVTCSSHEGFPMALLEAMSQGCASVSFDLITGPREIITDGEDGLLVSNGDFSELEEKIKWLIENQDKREFYSKNAIKNMRKFALDKILDRWEVLIQEVAAGKNKI